MPISSVNLSPSTTGTLTSPVPAGLDPQTPLSTLQRKEDGAIAQLSAFGQVKSSLSDLQNKAQALKNFSKPPTFGDFQVVVQGFVQSINSLNKNISQLTSKQGVLSADSRPGQVLGNVRQAVAGVNQGGLTSLQKMGISQQAGGTFSIDQKQMGKYFQDNRPGALSTMYEVANRVTQVADKHISPNGSIGKKMNDLSLRVNEPGNTRVSAQNYLDTQKTFQQTLPNQFASSNGSAARNAMAAYSSIASL